MNASTQLQIVLDCLQSDYRIALDNRLRTPLTDPKWLYYSGETVALAGAIGAVSYALSEIQRRELLAVEAN